MHVYPSYYKKTILLFFFTEYKNESKQHKSRRQKNQKSDLYNNKNKKIFIIDVIDVNKILVFKKEQYGKYNSFKYFIGYIDNDVIRPLCLKLSQMTGYINEFDEDKNENKNKNRNTIAMSLKVNDKELFKNHNKIWKKIERLMSIDFDSKPVYANDDKYIKTKIKTYKDSINTNFRNKEGSKKYQKKKYHANVCQ